jgi:HSP20 family protein
MAVVRYEPFTLVSGLHRQLDRIFADAFTRPAVSTEHNVAWIPSVDIHEEADQFVLRADVPGVDPKDIEVTAEKGVLTVRGERRFEKRENDAGSARFERVAGTFVRRFTLPQSAKADEIKARQTNGVLEITIPKQPKPEPKRISVQAA